MEKLQLISNMAVFFLSSLLFLLFNSSVATHTQSTKSSDLQTYIVHVRQPPTTTAFASSQDRESWHRSFFPTTITDSSDEDAYNRMVYSYEHVISGFAAMLSEDEVKAMEKKDDFLFAYPDSLLPLHTTRTPTFLGLKQEKGFWKDSNFGKGAIIGVLDTGILATHPSFSDEGMSTPPPKWKGRCEFNVCNKKIIGARSFSKGADAMLGRTSGPASIDDQIGHGTHVASIAAGAFVKSANVLGNANGTAAGMAPLAHLSIYKICSPKCSQADILAGVESAIEDGVDVWSISLGGDSYSTFYTRNIDIGTFKAMQNGIFVSCSAGNAGPSLRTLSNAAPWYMTVGASTTDRSIRAMVKLGNGESFNGESLFQPKDFKSNLMPVIYPGANGNANTIKCTNGSLVGHVVKGKVVLCEYGTIESVAKGLVVKNAGGAAMILFNTKLRGSTVEPKNHVLPASQVSFLDGLKIKAYINSASSPTATIVFKGTILGISPSPMVATFSSRGPSVPSPGILKPDIIGPGVSILAAASPRSEILFTLMSGTSMAAPHISGIAALLKISHPDWSPAAIKSAIMTTSDVVDNQGKQIVDETLAPANLFAIGAGHVNPSRANDPGLIYDLKPDDYIPYLCGLGYPDDKIGIVVGRRISCSSLTSIKEGDLNYPTFSVILGPSQSQTFNRTVTNVGIARSTYYVQIIKPQGVDVIVKPRVLYFSKVDTKLTYTVTLSRSSAGGSLDSVQGSLTWVSNSLFSKYVVRSPISVTFDSGKPGSPLEIPHSCCVGSNEMALRR